MLTRQVLLALAVVAALCALPLPLRAAPAALQPTTVQDQINAAPPGATVHLAAGTYTESLTINKNLTLAGADRATTVVAPPAGQRAVTITGNVTVHLQHMTIRGGQQPGGSGGGIDTQGGSVYVEDCLVQNNSAGYGGGLHQKGAGGKVYVIDSRFENNASTVHGGGLFLEDGDLWLTDTDMAGNTAGSHGGGVTVWAGNTYIGGGSFVNNRASGNGAGANVNASIFVTGTIFSKNVAGGEGGGMLEWNQGKTVNIAGAHFESNQSGHQGAGVWSRGNSTITGSTFISNTITSGSTGSDIAGAGVYAQYGSLQVSESSFIQNRIDCASCIMTAGAGIEADHASSAVVQGSQFVANRSWDGAGISSNAAQLTVQDSEFMSNTGGYGAGVSASQARIERSRFAGNTVVNQGGAISVGGRLDVERTRLTNNIAGVGGGAIWASGPLAITNTLMADNRSTVAGTAAALLLENPVGRKLSFVTVAYNGSAAGPAITMSDGSTQIIDTIIASHTVGTRITGGSLYQDYSLYTPATSGVVNAGGTLGQGPHMLYRANAGFQNPALGNYRLAGSSPAVNSGTDGGVYMDLKGLRRPVGAGYDMGMDEAPHYTFLPAVLKGQ